MLKASCPSCVLYVYMCAMVVLSYRVPELIRRHVLKLEHFGYYKLLKTSVRGASSSLFRASRNYALFCDKIENSHKLWSYSEIHAAQTTLLSFCTAERAILDEFVASSFVDSP